MKKAITTIISSALVLSMTAGCAEPEPSENPTTTTTNITIGDTDPVADLGDEGAEQYEKFMEKATEINGSDPLALFTIRGEYDTDREDAFYVLSVYTEEEVTDYVLIDGEWEVYDGPVSHNYESAYSYEEFINMPYITNYDYFMYNPMFSDGLLESVSARYVDGIDDGTWYGNLMAVSDDGSQALIMVGEPISFDRDEILGMDIGDAIGYGEATITNVTIDEDEDYTQVDIDFEDLSWMELASLPNGDPDRLYMRDYSGTLYFEEMVLVVVPISPDCEATGYVGLSDEEYDDYSSEDPTGSAFLDSELWYQVSNSDSTRRNNGWITAWRDAEPVVIENGEIVRLNF